MKFLKNKSSKKEYQNFIQSVNSEYSKLDIKFEFKNNSFHKECPKEAPDHYSIFAYWVAKKNINVQHANILDVGNTKVSNLISSIRNNVTALVLENPTDDISNVQWIIQDIAEPLKFKDATFDIFTSPGSLHLIGLGRYGDKKDPLALLKFLKELKRVMKNNSKMYLLLPLGMDQLLYGFHFIYSFETIQKIFNDWEITDYMVDNEMKFGFDKSFSKRYNRFDQNTDITKFKIGQYKIIYLEFIKK